MTDKLDQSLANLADVAATLAQKLAVVATENAQPAMDMILATYRFEGAATIGKGFIWAGAAAGLLKTCFWLAKKSEGHNEGYIFGSIFSGAGALGAAVLSTIGILDTWAWAALIDPRLYLAHVLRTKVGG